MEKEYLSIKEQIELLKKNRNDFKRLGRRNKKNNFYKLL